MESSLFPIYDPNENPPKTSRGHFLGTQSLETIKNMRKPSKRKFLDTKIPKKQPQTLFDQSLSPKHTIFQHHKIPPPLNTERNFGLDRKNIITWASHIENLVSSLAMYHGVHQMYPPIRSTPLEQEPNLHIIRNLPPLEVLHYYAGIGLTCESREFADLFSIFPRLQHIPYIKKLSTSLTDFVQSMIEVGKSHNNFSDFPLPLTKPIYWNYEIRMNQLEFLRQEIFDLYNRPVRFNKLIYARDTKSSPAKGRDVIGFHENEHPGHVYVKWIFDIHFKKRQIKRKSLSYPRLLD